LNSPNGFLFLFSLSLSLFFNLLLTYVRTRFDDNVILSVQSLYVSIFESGLVVISVGFTRFIPNTSAFIRHFYARPDEIKRTPITFSY